MRGWALLTARLHLRSPARRETPGGSALGVSAPQAILAPERLASCKAFMWVFSESSPRPAEPLSYRLPPCVLEWPFSRASSVGLGL